MMSFLWGGEPWSVMKRILEPELMDDDEQAQAYAEADFEDAHDRFVEHFERVFGNEDIGRTVLDLGCGPGSISIRFARSHPASVVHGVDGSMAMLRYGQELLSRSPDVGERVRLMHGMLPGASLPHDKYDSVISNSLLHHLPDPLVLWNAVCDYAVHGAPVFVMDLFRPATVDRAKELVAMHAAGEPEVLRRDFFNSLLAAFELDEIDKQLKDSGLDMFSVEQISDRHMIVTGRAP